MNATTDRTISIYNSSFLVGEPYDHHARTGQPRFDGYREKDGRYWTANRPMTRKEFAAEMLKPVTEVA